MLVRLHPGRVRDLDVVQAVVEYGGVDLLLVARMRSPIFLVSLTPFLTVPSGRGGHDEPALDRSPCLERLDDVLASPRATSSTVQTLGRSDWSLSMVIGRISRMLLVRKF